MTGTTLVHRLDPRTKLAVQFGVVVVAFRHTDPVPLAILTGGIVLATRLSGLSITSLVSELRYLIGFLVIAPAIATIQLQSPWLDPAAGWQSGLAAYRVLLLVITGLLFVRTTTPREVRAAIQWFVPGRIGRGLGLGVALVFRFLPILRAEVQRSKRAITLRGGGARPLTDRLRLLGVVVLVRQFRRTDQVSRALSARCLSWNPTLPRLRFGRVDVVGGLCLLILASWTASGILTG